MALLSGCDTTRTPEAFDNTPKGYVEFFIPAEDPALTELHIDAQIFRVRDGERIFEGMTQKWKGLDTIKHGLLVAVPPGEHVFSIEVAGGTTPVKVSIEKDMYQPVRISASGIKRSQIMGMSNRIQFRIDATVETPTLPSGSANSP